MTPFDFARFGGEPERLRCNAEQTRRLGQIEPWLVPIRRRPKDRDLMMRSERGDPLPSFPTPTEPTIPHPILSHEAVHEPLSELSFYALKDEC